MYPRLLLSLLVLSLASCAQRGLKQEYPATWIPGERAKSPRWVIANAPSHTAALAPLKRARSRQGYEVITIPPGDPQSIRQRVTDLRLGERRNDCLLLVGTTATLPSARGLHHRMRGLPSDARHAMAPTGSTPLFAVGRLPAASPGQTRQLVTRILAFEQERAGQTNKRAILLVGDPMGGAKRMKAAELLVSHLSKTLVAKAHPSWTFTGAADVRGHAFSTTPQEFPAAFRRELNRPYVVGAYFGHSSSKTLCHTSGGTGTLEGILRHSFGRDSWDTLTPSSQRGLFLSCGCYCLDGDDAVGYRSVKAPGGPVAFIGATQESYSAIGYLAAKGAVEAMEGRPPRTAGDWLLAVQNAIAKAPISRPLFFAFDKVDGSNGKLSLLEQREEHLEMWMLVGDPATRLF